MVVDQLPLLIAIHGRQSLIRVINSPIKFTADALYVPLFDQLIIDAEIDLVRSRGLEIQDFHKE